jgi:hypothetical protein
MDLWIAQQGVQRGRAAQRGRSGGGGPEPVPPAERPPRPASARPPASVLTASACSAALQRGEVSRGGGAFGQDGRRMGCGAMQRFTYRTGLSPILSTRIFKEKIGFEC